ncbi:potassium channel, subfamily K, member 7 [Mugil cephalus]|uniref:potassium channel, subfamily K, member 7 n=1 Tax=Mugil cephalus TaxID=48193 RepID=UPI001FB7F2F6|nr:potassium channel, subfamily K, member 7 [Mugil cephalus]
MSRLVSSLGVFLQVNAFACLTLSYLLYVLLGGLVFTLVERPVEEELRAEVEELHRAFLRENPCVEEGRLGELLGRALWAQDSDVAVLNDEADETGSDFTSSLYFVIVTLTTIGSDTYTPKSDEAKLFCIFYCTLGIPFTMFLLTLLSRLLLPVVTHAPLYHLRYLWGLPHPHAALVHSLSLFVLVVLVLFVLPALLVSVVVEPDWSFLDALFFCFVTLSTVGQGGSSLGRSWGPTAKETLKLLTTCYLVVGLVAIVVFKDTLLQVPQVLAAMRLFSGPHYTDLEGFHLGEMTLSNDGCEGQPEYSQSVCTISSTPLELKSPCSDLPRDGVLATKTTSCS